MEWELERETKLSYRKIKFHFSLWTMHLLGFYKEFGISA